MQKLNLQNWLSIKILHYRPLQHADRPKLRKLWQKCHWRHFWPFLGVFFWRHCLFFNFLMGKPVLWQLWKVPHGLPMKDLPFGAFRVLLRLILKLLMSKMSKTNFFPNFPRVPTLHQNWMKKWIFLQKLKRQHWSSIKILHYRPLQHADRPKLSELWQNCYWHDFWSFLGVFFAAIVFFF